MCLQPGSPIQMTSSVSPRILFQLWGGFTVWIYTCATVLRLALNAASVLHIQDCAMLSFGERACPLVLTQSHNYPRKDRVVLLLVAAVTPS